MINIYAPSASVRIIGFTVFSLFPFHVSFSLSVRTVVSPDLPLEDKGISMIYS
jgi:hypothetical protein